MVTKSSNDSDHILNRYSLGLARSSQVLQSWLPKSSKTPASDELDRTDEDIFTPSFDEDGVGAYIPRDIDESDSRQKRSMREDDLRRKIFGKNASKQRNEAANFSKHALVTPIPNKESRRLKRPRDLSDSDEEGGRASAFESKRSKVSESNEGTLKRHSTTSVSRDEPRVLGIDALGSESDNNGNRMPSEAKAGDVPELEVNNALKQASNKLATTYLDEILSQHAEKRKGKRKKKKKNKKDK